MTDPEDKLTPEQDEFARRAGKRLRDSADALDGATRSRLNQARQRALAELDLKATPAGGGRWLPAGAAAAVTVLVIGIWLGRTPDESVTPLPVAFDQEFAEDNVVDFELLLDENDFEMIEDLEFFVWLSEDELEAIG